MLESAEFWIWDIWLARHGGSYHLFYLHAPRSLGDPELRHTSARVGHAVSTDLRSWEPLRPALVPGDSGAWDDVATWTGSVFGGEDLWEMYYTGIGSELGRPIQRIGRALSRDLTEWTKEPVGPVSEIDRGVFETYPESGWHNQAWRDPFVYRDARGERAMLITARAGGPGVPLDERGVVAVTRSADGVTWGRPSVLAAPRISGDLEVPQLLEVGGIWFLIFCTVRPSAALQARGITGCVIGYLRSSSPDGPFTWDDDQLLASGDEGIFAPRIIRDPAGDLTMIGWQRVAPDGEFGGWVTDPYPLVVSDGRLSRV